MDPLNDTTAPIPAEDAPDDVLLVGYMHGLPGYAAEWIKRNSEPEETLEPETGQTPEPAEASTEYVDEFSINDHNY